MQQKPVKTRAWLTNYCDNLRIFISVIMIQIVVVIYSLSFFENSFDFLHKFSVLTLVSQFIGLTILILLCKLKHFFNSLNVVTGVIVLSLFIVVVTSLMAQIIGFLDFRLTFGLFLNREEINYLNFKLSLAYIIIFLALSRYFYIQDQWQKQIRKLSDARLIALQARIKPHFLFNTLNSISSLIAIDSNRAEKAIGDLSGLMRRGFSNKEKFICIEEELQWIEQYLALEKLRLDSRLKYSISCEEELYKVEIPVLCIQPLVENAILHGIQPLENGGLIDIQIFKKDNQLMIRVINPYLKSASKKTQSNGMALKNIKERLELYYGKKGFMKINDIDEMFIVEIGLPL